jgi:hypothetical protein
MRKKLEYFFLRSATAGVSQRTRTTRPNRSSISKGVFNSPGKLVIEPSQSYPRPDVLAAALRIAPLRPVPLLQDGVPSPHSYPGELSYVYQTVKVSLILIASSFSTRVRCSLLLKFSCRPFFQDEKMVSRIDLDSCSRPGIWMDQPHHLGTPIRD